jgi:proteasome component ECM29
MDTSTSNVQSLLKEAKNELATLNRVSHRLAMTDAGPQLEKVLTVLLPRLLRRIGQNHENTTKFTITYSCPNELEQAIKNIYDQIHAKIVEMMSHVMKRVRADLSCKLPCLAILEMLYNIKEMAALRPASINPFTLNLSLTFLTIGVPRCSKDQLEAILPGLLACLGAHSTFASLKSISRKNQVFQITHLVLRTIEGVVVGGRKTATKTSSSTTSPNTISGEEESEMNTNKKENYLEMVRQICSQDDVIGRVVYDLFLDVMLYQSGNESATLPPPGLSSFGKERLSCGNSVIAKNWAFEHASGSRLKDLKIALLEFVAPCRRFDLFNISGRNVLMDETSRVATSRAVALMVVCSGDQNLDVAERASSFLKAHLDSMRNTTKTGHDNISIDGVQKNSSDQVLNLLGNPIALLSELLSAVLGGIIASNAIEKISNLSNCITTLGQPFGVEGDNNTLMSTKRRMVAAKNGTTIITFLTMRVVDDVPSIFTPSSMKNCVEIMNTEYLQACFLRANVVGTLTCLCAFKYAKSASSLSGLSVTGTAGNPSIAAMKLMNSVCVRLAALFDAMTSMKEHKTLIGHELVSIHDCLARCFSNACAIISTAASPHAGDVTSPVGVEARDAAYGIISTICRSNMVTFGDSVILNCGESDESYQGSLCVLSAKVLFGCVRNETENLRPRAVASLDSLLAAYCRLLETNQAPAKEEIQSDLSGNPWAMQIDESLTENNFEAKFVSLANALIPLLWNALQPTFPKASRHAAAQWAEELLKPIDLNSACHILCYVSGDSDVTAASLSNVALGIDGQIGLDIATSSVQGQEIAVPGFHEFAEAVFAQNGSTSLWRPRFYDFNPASKGASIRFGLVCLLSDLYGGIDNSITSYLRCISCALNEATTTKNVGTAQLLDEVSICFAGLLRTSKFARAAIASDESLNAVRIAELALSAPSSKARRYLAEAYLCLVEDGTIWTTTGLFQPLQWKERTSIESIIKTCVGYLTDMTSTTAVAANIHGAAYLGASCIKVLRNFWTGNDEDTERELRNCLIHASNAVTALGRGLLHLDEALGNACAGALTNAFSDNNVDTPILCDLLSESSSTVLELTNESMKRFGNGDHTDELRVTMIARAAGVLLSVTTVHGKSQGNDIGRRRLECVEALLALLGSSANKKDPELALVVGEALSNYADAYSPEGCVWTYPDIDKPSEYNQTYADDLPPHAQVSFFVIIFSGTFKIFTNLTIFIQGSL